MPFDGTAFSPVADQAVGPDAPRWSDRLRRLFGLRARRSDGKGFLAFREPAPEPTVGTILLTARSLIENEERWIKGHYTTLDGRHCAVGALRAAALRLNGRRVGKGAQDALREVARHRGFRSIEQMNDHSTHEDVISAFDAAIMAVDRRSFQG